MEKIVVGNMKMNLNEEEIDEYVYKISKYNHSNIELFLAPSFIYLEKFKSGKFNLTAQDVSIFYDGSYTGEISASQLKSIGVNSVIIGHSERRKFFNETSTIINEKLKQAFFQKLKPILCIGEDEINSLEDTFKILKLELENDLVNIDINEDLIVAYEPVYAIGTGTVIDIERIKFIINKLNQYFYDKYEKNIKIIYGGSVNEKNIEDIVKICDGVIVGKMSLNVEKFMNLIDKIK